MTTIQPPRGRRRTVCHRTNEAARGAIYGAEMARKVRSDGARVCQLSEYVRGYGLVPRLRSPVVLADHAIARADVLTNHLTASRTRPAVSARASVGWRRACFDYGAGTVTGLLPPMRRNADGSDRGFPIPAGSTPAVVIRRRRATRCRLDLSSLRSQSRSCGGVHSKPGMVRYPTRRFSIPTFQAPARRFQPPRVRAPRGCACWAGVFPVAMRFPRAPGSKTEVLYEGR